LQQSLRGFGCYAAIYIANTLPSIFVCTGLTGNMPCIHAWRLHGIAQKLEFAAETALCARKANVARRHGLQSGIQSTGVVRVRFRQAVDLRTQPPRQGGVGLQVDPGARPHGLLID
jgi:hypothetical protein